METGGGFSYEELDLKDALVVLRFVGKGAKAAFAPEAGGHRVQQVSPTEKKGRVHSSTVTVAVLPEPTMADLKINPSDLKFETYRGSGPGGQHRNTSDTAVRVTHIPTGIQACSEIKSQAQNKALALSALRARILAKRQEKANLGRNCNRKRQVGTGMRSDKVRTIAYQRARVENHLNGKRMKIRDYERGMIEKIH
jgi:peptide chain release factor 1